MCFASFFAHRNIEIVAFWRLSFSRKKVIFFHWAGLGGWAGCLGWIFQKNLRVIPVKFLAFWRSRRGLHFGSETQLVIVDFEAPFRRLEGRALGRQLVTLKSSSVLVI